MPQPALEVVVLPAPPKIAARAGSPSTSGRDITREFAAGELIQFPGTRSSLLRLVTGLVRVHAVDEDGYGVTLRYVKPGGYFGEGAIVGGAQNYFAEAVVESSAVLLDASELTLEGLTNVTSYLIGVVDRMGTELVRLARKPLKARVAAELLELADSALAEDGEDGQPVISLTHDELATAVGSVRETVTKVIGELSRVGAIRTGYAKIIIRDEKLLADVAGT